MWRRRTGGNGRFADLAGRTASGPFRRRISLGLRDFCLVDRASVLWRIGQGLDQTLARAENLALDQFADRVRGHDVDLLDERRVVGRRAHGDRTARAIGAVACCR